MKVRIVVTDESEANFFDVDGFSAPPQWVAKLQNERARLHDRDIESDRPGRSFDRMGTGRHALDGERSPQRQQQLHFARQIAREMDNARQAHAFDRLVIIAGPRMLGLLRDALPEASRSSVAAEVSKDLVHLDAATLRDYIPREVFRNM